MRIGSWIVGAMTVGVWSTTGAQITRGFPSDGSTFIHFEPPIGGPLVTNQYAAQGMTIAGGAAYLTNSQFSAAFGSATQVWNSFFQPLTFTFAQPITFLGFWEMSNGDVTFTEANGSLTLLGSQGFVHTWWVGIEDATPFSSVTVNQNGPGGFVFDDLAFTPVSTPEPGSLGLLFTGIVGAIGVLRRRVRGATLGG